MQFLSIYIRLTCITVLEKLVLNIDRIERPIEYDNGGLWCISLALVCLQLRCIISVCSILRIILDLKKHTVTCSTLTHVHCVDIASY